jgi:hypothetical protein
MPLLAFRHLLLPLLQQWTIKGLIVWTQCKINFAESAKSLLQDFILGRLLVRDANHFLDEPQTIKL